MGPVLQREADAAFRRDVGLTHRDGAMPGIAGGRWRHEECAGTSQTWTSSWPAQPLSNTRRDPSSTITSTREQHFQGTKDLESTRRVV